MFHCLDCRHVGHASWKTTYPYGPRCPIEEACCQECGSTRQMPEGAMLMPDGVTIWRPLSKANFDALLGTPPHNRVLPRSDTHYYRRFQCQTCKNVTVRKVRKGVGLPRVSQGPCTILKGMSYCEGTKVKIWPDPWVQM